MRLIPEQVTENTGPSHRPRENYIIDQHRNVCRSDGGCGGYGDGVPLQLKKTLLTPSSKATDRSKHVVRKY